MGKGRTAGEIRRPFRGKRRPFSCCPGVPPAFLYLMRRKGPCYAQQNTVMELGSVSAGMLLVLVE